MMRRQVAATAVVAILAVLSPTLAIAEPDRFEIDYSMLRGDVTERQSGEIRVKVPRVFADPDENLYTLTLAFESRGRYEAALESPFGKLELADFAVFLVRRETGELDTFVNRKNEGKQLSFGRLLESAESAICGNTILRTWTQLGNGIEMGVSVQASYERIKPHRVGSEKNTIPISCRFDVNDDCDHWAINGCGGPLCVNRCTDPIFDITFDLLGDCVEEEVFGFNTCACF